VVPAVRQGHSLTLTFQLPSLFDAYRAKPEDYVSHLVGHEGAGSLLSALKASGWASAVSAGVNESGFERNSALFVFEITITLTEAGLHHSPGGPSNVFWQMQATRVQYSGEVVPSGLRKHAVTSQYRLAGREDTL
jgi:hypothetical protein